MKSKWIALLLGLSTAYVAVANTILFKYQDEDSSTELAKKCEKARQILIVQTFKLAQEIKELRQQLESPSFNMENLQAIKEQHSDQGKRLKRLAAQVLKIDSECQEHFMKHSDQPFQEIKENLIE